MIETKIDFCSFEAAKYAVTHWHYSKSMPAGKTVKIGLWENSFFVGAIVYGLGANKNINKEFGLQSYEVCELCRIAFTHHETPVSRALSISLKMLKKQSPGLKVVVSYADANQGHNGAIYQAMNWIYLGEFAREQGIPLNGKLVHRRTISARYNTSSLEWLRQNVDKNSDVIRGLPKYKYIYVFDKMLKEKYAEKGMKYPKRERGEIDNAPESNRETGGASPTRSL
ncbi:MAG TPA: protein Mom [Anaerolineales bacterium]|nr:protein Mom [Anaerolineales bacterium]